MHARAECGDLPHNAQSHVPRQQRLSSDEHDREKSRDGCSKQEAQSRRAHRQTTKHSEDCY